MDSKELNRRIREICDGASFFGAPEGYGYEAFGGKPIAYIGWFWRQVDFDNFDRLFGVLPPDEEHDYPLIGFMQNNKWDYSYVKASEEQWVRIKELLVEAAENPTRDSLEAVDEAIQAVGKR